VVIFFRRALYWRQAQLGIYTSPEDYDDCVITEEAGREKLRSDVGALNWFLSTPAKSGIETYFENDGLAVQSFEVLHQITAWEMRERVIVYDNDNRPPRLVIDIAILKLF
jgi:hypothetical protein